VRFTEIPDDELEFHKGTRMLFRGPAGSGIGDLETMRREVDGLPLAAITARVELEPGDLELLQAGHPIYVTQYGGLIPMCVDIPAERVEIPDTAQAWIDGYRDGLSG
jgi:hypothetical protein